MRRLLSFALVAAIFEVLALILKANAVVFWLVEAIIALFVLYLVWLAVRGWRKQLTLTVHPVMTGRVVRRRHWHLF